MTSWRKKESFKKNVNSSSKSENFSNIPMFNVLQNSDNKHTIEKPLIEGLESGGEFDIQGLGYFQQHGKLFQKSVDLSKVKEYIKKLMSYFSSPVVNVDKMIEKSICDILKMFLMINHIECNNDTVSTLHRSSSNVSQAFYWTSDQIKQTITKEHFVNQGGKTYTNVEEFSLNQQPSLNKTINSFQKNHPDFIKDKTIRKKVGKFYINKLNGYETKIRRRMTSDELFIFNNDFDDSLNKKSIQNEINVLRDEPVHKNNSDPLYEDTEADYNNYYNRDNLARFKMDNKTEIEYNPLDAEFFPKLDTESLMVIVDRELNKAKDKNKMLTGFYFVTESKITPKISKPSNIVNILDDTATTKWDNSKYNKQVFSVDMTKTQSTPIQDYLLYVIKHFSLIIFEKLIESKDNVLGFQEIEARVGTIYTSLLNRLEFLLYSRNSKYLDNYMLSVFNHVFFILIQQDSISNNPYNSVGNIYIAIVEGNSLTSNIVNCRSIFDRVIWELNYRYPIILYKINSDNTLLKFSKVVIDGKSIPDETVRIPIPYESSAFIEMNVNNIIELPPVGMNFDPFEIKDNTNNNYQYLTKYILSNVSIKSEEMEKYFISSHLSECEKLKQRIGKDLEGYAKTIKNEIYRIVLIPIMLYVAYNIYYMFFFKDIDGPLTDETGANIHTSSNHKYPIFTDYETYFHSYDNHKTDYILEFVFKPVKMLYTLLNTLLKTFRSTKINQGLKGMIINPIFDIKEIPPYIWLFSVVILVYYGFKKYGGRILNFYSKFFNTWIVPFVKLFKIDSTLFTAIFKTNNIDTKYVGFAEIAALITSIFFFFTVIRENTPVDLVQLIKGVMGYGSLEEPSYKPIKMFSIWWVITTPRLIIMFFKFIAFLIYWILKFMITSALIPLSCSIGLIYITYNILFSVYNNTDYNCDYSSKMDFINRIMYSKLFDKTQDNSWRGEIKQYFRYACLMCMFFMTEAILLYVLISGYNTITKEISGGDQAPKIQLGMLGIYITFFVLIGLWCLYKYKVKLPVLKAAYDITEGYKRFTFTENPANLNQYDKQSAKEIFVNSDQITKDLIEKSEREKNETPEKAPKQTITDKWAGKIFGTMGSVGDSIFKKTQGIFDNLNKPSTDSESILDVGQKAVNIIPGAQTTGKAISSGITNVMTTVKTGWNEIKSQQQDKNKK